jgi:hypothetical protein
LSDKITVRRSTIDGQPIPDGDYRHAPQPTTCVLLTGPELASLRQYTSRVGRYYMVQDEDCEGLDNKLAHGQTRIALTLQARANRAEHDHAAQ